MNREEIERNEQKEDEYWQARRKDGKYPCDHCNAKNYVYEVESHGGEMNLCDGCVKKYVCPECEIYQPNDERVIGGMKCGRCAYGM